MWHLKPTYQFYVMALLPVFLLSSNLANAQNTDSLQQTKPVTTTLGLVYNNNANFYGQTADEKLPYIALSGTLKFKKGFYINGLMYRLFKDSLAISAGGLGAGYEFGITKNLSGDVSYMHTFYPAGSPFLQASSPGIGSLLFKYEHWAVTGLGLDVTFGKQTDYFVTLTNSKSFDFYTADNKSIISLTPQVDIVAGTQQFYKTYIIEKEKKNNGKGNGPPATPPGQTTTITNVTNRFGLIAYNFVLPLAYNRSKYMLEAAYQLSVLGNNAATNPGKANSFITLSAYYQF